MQAIIKETEDLLEKWKHPDPYRPPTAPGGMSLCGERGAWDAILIVAYRFQVRAQSARAHSRS